MNFLFQRIFIIVVLIHGLGIFFSVFTTFNSKLPLKTKGPNVFVQTIELTSSITQDPLALSEEKENQGKAQSEEIKPQPPISVESPISSPKPVDFDPAPSQSVSPEIRQDKTPIDVKPDLRPTTSSKPIENPKPVSKPDPKSVPKKPTPIPTPTPTPKPKPKPEAKADVVNKPKSSPEVKKTSSTTNKAIPKTADAIPPKTANPPQKNEKREKLLAQAREKIGKIQKVKTSANNFSAKNASTNSVEAPKLIGELQSDSFSLLGSSANGNSPETIYGNELINRLKRLLHLPEYGDVDIELTIAKSGKILAMKILSDENRNNRIYIEKVLPSLSLPPFGSYFEGEAQHTFVIRLTSTLSK